MLWGGGVAALVLVFGAGIAVGAIGMSRAVEAARQEHERRFQAWLHGPEFQALMRARISQILDSPEGQAALRDRSIRILLSGGESGESGTTTPPSGSG